ncbi:hypothetical protein BS78_06G053900 [Paspalum vaginatum]|nr:hypothetical protein BS78_06G053900 [Paspalum vaginatum]
MEANNGNSGAMPPRKAEASHSRPPTHPREVVLPPLETQFQPPPGFRAVQPVSISLPVSPGSFSIPTPTAVTTDSADLRRQAMANAARAPHRLGAQGNGSSSVRRSWAPARLAGRAGRGRRTAAAMNWDRLYDSFKTWSGKLERQITHLAGGPEGSGDIDDDAFGGSHRTCASSPSEDLVRPSDRTWPFLLRFPVSAFGICMGVSSQAILWKVIATSVPTTFLLVTSKVNLVLWCVSVALMCAVSATYACKVALYFEAVRHEYYHPIRVNFFFAPWITCLYLVIGVPYSMAKISELPHWLWYLLMAPLLCLGLKIYGQWMSGGQRGLSKVANPSNHLSVLGNFVGAQLGATMGLREGPVFFFAVGLAHYVVLFVTLYQRLPTNETLPKELHPVFFLFVAAPSVSSVAWAKIMGEFAHVSRVAFFVAMFLYASLAVQVNFFRGFRFSLAWWAYMSPTAGAAAAAISYSSEVDNAFTKALCVALSVVAVETCVVDLVEYLSERIHEHPLNYHVLILNYLILEFLFTTENSISIRHLSFHKSSWGLLSLVTITSKGSSLLARRMSSTHSITKKVLCERRKL